MNESDLKNKLIEYNIESKTDDELDKYLSEGNPLLIIFYLTGCPACIRLIESKKFGSTIKELKNNNIIKIVAIDGKYFSKYNFTNFGVFSYPTIKVFSTSPQCVYYPKKSEKPSKCSCEVETSNLTFQSIIETLKKCNPIESNKM